MGGWRKKKRRRPCPVLDPDSAIPSTRPNCRRRSAPGASTPYRDENMTTTPRHAETIYFRSFCLRADPEWRAARATAFATRCAMFRLKTEVHVIGSLFIGGDHRRDGVRQLHVHSSLNRGRAIDGSAGKFPPGKSEHVVICWDTIDRPVAITAHVRAPQLLA